MKKKLKLNKVIVKKSPTHGFGVFAEKNIRKHEVIEECYFIISKGGDRGLEDFYFDAQGKHAVFLGYGSIYNHAEEPNADYALNLKTRIATISAERGIKQGEEIFISYGDKWFSDRGWTPRTTQASRKKRMKKKVRKSKGRRK